MHIQITKRVTMEEEDLYRMVKAFLNVPDSVGVALRPELNHDDTVLVGLQVDWIEPPAAHPPTLSQAGSADNG